MAGKDNEVRLIQQAGAIIADVSGEKNIPDYSRAIELVDQLGAELDPADFNYWNAVKNKIEIIRNGKL